MYYTRRSQRIQEGQFFKSTSNLALIADSESTQNSVKIRPKIIDFPSFCVELWTKQVLYRILVPMSYISLLDVNIRHPRGVQKASKSVKEASRRSKARFTRVL